MSLQTTGTRLMKKVDLLQVLDALESVEAELEMLMLDNEWFVTEVNDKVADAKERVMEDLNGKVN